MTTPIDAPTLIRPPTTGPAATARGPQVTREHLVRQLRPTLEALLAARGGLGGIEPMGLARKSADTSDKYLVRDSLGQPSAVLSLSPAERPHATGVAADSTRMAHAALGPRLGRVVLMPWRAAQRQRHRLQRGALSPPGERASTKTGAGTPASAASGPAMAAGHLAPHRAHNRRARD